LKYVKLKKLILCLVTVASLWCGNTLAGPQVSKITPSVLGVVYVMFKPSAAHLASALAGESVATVAQDRSQYENILRSIGATAIIPFDAYSLDDSIAIASGVSRIFVVHFSNEIVPINVVDLFLACGEIEASSPRYLFPLLDTPNDPKVTGQYALRSMNMFSAWDLSKGDTNTVIADVDLGTNYNHEDLAQSIKYNLGEVGTDSKGKDKRTNKVDDDKDGVVDNWLGVNIVGSGTDQNFQPTADPIPGNASANHGTITAGLIAARANNSIGIAGTGYNCKLMVIRADDGNGNVAGGYEGIHYALVHGARVINCSWGGPIDVRAFGILEAIVTEATSHNALIVAATGNNANNIDSVSFAPAVLTGVLAVGATDSTDAPAGFSNYGHRVDCYAPGVNVLSTNWPGNDQYIGANGTSFSSPEVAGIVGLLMSKHPTWPIKFIKQQIINTCDNVVRPMDRFHYWGRVNAGAALGAPTSPGLVIESYSVNGVKSGSVDTAGSVSNLVVTFKNYIGNGQNLSANLLLSGGASVDQSLQQIGNLPTDVTRQLSYTLRRNAQFSNGSLPLYFAVTDGASYNDTLLLLVPLRPQHGFAFVDSLDGYCSSVKQVTPAIGWVTNGYEDGTNVISDFELESDFSWNNFQPVNDQLAAPWCVEALDDQTAWVGSASRTGKIHPRILSTQDGGSSWAIVEVTGITPYVNSIHFTSQLNGMFVGDPHNGNWGIGVTVDGGTTWKASTSTSSALAGEVGWKNSISWVRKNGWFGTNKGEIYKTTDGGFHWNAHQLAGLNIVGVGFDDDSLHGIAVSRTGAKALGGTPTGAAGIFRTTDGGSTWTSIALPTPNTVPSDVKFVPGLDLAFVATNTGIYSTKDFGANLTFAGIPAQWSGADATISIASDTKQFVATAASLTGSISFGGPMPRKEAVAWNQLFSGVELLQSSPNPSSFYTSIKYLTARDEHVRLSLYDALGRKIALIFEGNVEQGEHWVSLSSTGLTSGVYEYVLETNSGVRQSRKLTIVK
jgi:photosystem II stability/assembly factor-like uncharacterized protein